MSTATFPNDCTTTELWENPIEWKDVDLGSAKTNMSRQPISADGLTVHDERTFPVASAIFAPAFFMIVSVAFAVYFANHEMTGGAALFAMFSVLMASAAGLGVVARRLLPK